MIIRAWFRRFHDIQWSSLGSEPSGLIYGGCEDGGIYIYNADKLLRKASDSLLGTTQGLHAGPVFTLSCNYLKVSQMKCRRYLGFDHILVIYLSCSEIQCKLFFFFKANFVACGSSDSEVTVWDVTNLTAPIIPGKKLSLGADVSCVEFNR